MSDNTRRRRAIDSAVEGPKRRKKRVVGSGIKNRVRTRLKLESLTGRKQNQSTDSNQ